MTLKPYRIIFLIEDRVFSFYTWITRLLIKADIPLNIKKNEVIGVITRIEQLESGETFKLVLNETSKIWELADFDFEDLEEEANQCFYDGLGELV